MEIEPSAHPKHSMEFLQEILQNSTFSAENKLAIISAAYCELFYETDKIIKLLQST